MIRSRILVVVLAVWLVALGMALQPHRRQPPVIEHAHLLDRPNLNLPTLGSGVAGR